MGSTRKQRHNPSSLALLPSSSASVDRLLWPVRTVSGLLCCVVFLCCVGSYFANYLARTYKEPALQSICSLFLGPWSFLRASSPAGFTRDPFPSGTPAKGRVPAGPCREAGTAYSPCAAEASAPASWGSCSRQDPQICPEPGRGMVLPAACLLWNSPRLLGLVGLLRGPHSPSVMEEEEGRRHLGRYDLEEPGRGPRTGDIGDVRGSPMHLAFTTGQLFRLHQGHQISNQ